jgi:hypothetical protein
MAAVAGSVAIGLYVVSSAEQQRQQQYVPQPPTAVERRL